MEEIEKGGQFTVPERPNFLTALCILTFISAGMGSMSALMTPPFSDLLVEFVNINPTFDESVKAEVVAVLTAGWGYHFPIFVLSACSFAGAILMWNLKKVGFHFYALSNLLLLFVPMLILGTVVPFGNILFTASFIGLYAIHLKIMK